LNEPFNTSCFHESLFIGVVITKVTSLSDYQWI